MMEKTFKDLAQFAKEHGVKSVLVVMVDRDNDVNWHMESATDFHKAMMCLTLEDVRGDIKADLFNEVEEDV